MESSPLIEELPQRITSHYESFNKMISLVPSYFYKSHTKSNMENQNPYIHKKVGVTTPAHKLRKREKQLLKTWKEQQEFDHTEKETEASTTETSTVPGFIDSDIVAEREELKKRLREKLNTLRAKRNAPPLSDDAKATEPPTKRARVERKRRQQRENSNKSSPSQSSKSQSTPQTTDDATIEYATFDFSSGDPVPTYLQNKKKPSKSQLLKQVQEKKRKQQELQGTEQGDALVKQEAWDTMKKRAQGEKVKNDVEKLKKSIKREQQTKKKSKKEWSQRLNTQKKTQYSAQKKRSENIAAAKERRLERRQGKRKKTASKKQRVGFEGKRKEIINK